MEDIEEFESDESDSDYFDRILSDCEKKQEFNLIIENKKSNDFVINVSQNSYGKNGRTSCGAISLSLIYIYANGKFEKITEPLKLDWKEVINSGIKLFNYWKEDSPKNRDYHTVAELYEIKRFKVIRERLNFICEIVGPIHINSESEKIRIKKMCDEFGGLVMSLDDSIEKIFELGKDNYSSITIRSITFTLLNTGFSVWLYDSHDIPNKIGQSLLIEFFSAPSLSEFIKKKFRYIDTDKINDNNFLFEAFYSDGNNIGINNTIYKSHMVEYTNNYTMTIFQKNC